VSSNSPRVAFLRFGDSQISKSMIHGEPSFREALRETLCAERRAIRASVGAGYLGTVLNFVCGAIIAPMEGDYGNQEGHVG
jgi:hypothetical protein